MIFFKRSWVTVFLLHYLILLESLGRILGPTKRGQFQNTSSFSSVMVVTAKELF